jgi:hypothetical protein
LGQTYSNQNPRWSSFIAIALLIYFLSGCNPQTQLGESEATGTEKATTVPSSKAASLGGTMTLTVPSVVPKASEEICALRQKTLEEIFAVKSQQILEYCNRKSHGDCALRDQCFNGLVRIVDPGEIRLSLTVSQSDIDSSLAQGTGRIFLIDQSTSRNENRDLSNLTVFFGFSWTFGSAMRNSSKETCVAPLDTTRGRAFVSSLIRQLNQAALNNIDDPCHQIATGGGSTAPNSEPTLESQ